MPKCPICESKLEELTEITGYHYWMCGNSDCEMSYKFYRKAAQQSAQADKACTCIKPWYFPRRVNDQCLECGGSISLATKA